MIRVIFAFVLFCFASNATFAQPQTREELEKQRQQLKKEIDDAQKLLNSNQVVTKQNLTTLTIMARKESLQERVVGNINQDIHILDNNIYTIQRDVNRYDRLLDTLRQEYAKSMVYAYKNRGNYEFLNFIFSAENFNDAVKRVAYLKSYRSYRELQGENIIRTQELRKKRLVDLGASKETKSATLDVQSKEMAELQSQRNQQDKIVAYLKRQGKDLNTRIAARQKDMAKVNAAVKAAIARAIKEERDRRDALAKAAAAKAAADLATAKNNAATNNSKTTTASTTKKSTIKDAPVKAPENIKLNDENASIALSSNFKSNQGSLPWPVDNGFVLMHYGRNVMKNGGIIDLTGITISSSAGSNVKAVFDGTVILVQEVEEGKNMITVKHGEYYTTYSNLSNVIVRKDQAVKTGQNLGKVALNLDGIGAIDFFSTKNFTDLDPEKWLRNR